MEKYLIEVPHEENEQSCVQAVKVFMESGSHFMTHADYGCEDNEHKAWMIVELDNKEMARSLLPPAYRAQAKIVKLTTYDFGDLHEGMESHSAS